MVISSQPRVHPLLRVEHLKIGSLPALSFSVADGECLAIEGPSGSGKTRLLRAIADLDAAPGHVFLDGVERHEIAGPQWRRAVQYAAAEPAWWTDTPREAMPITPATAARIERTIAALGLNPGILNQPLARLSTGERQRLALARSFAYEARAFLLDEPTAALDSVSAGLVEEQIRFQLLSGRSVLLASHDQGLIGRISHARLQLARPTAPIGSQPR